jgi:hypothetical protein
VQGAHSVLRRGNGNVTGRDGESGIAVWAGNRAEHYRLAFVTIGALLGIKPIGRDAEHVVALDAHAVDDGTDDGAGLRGFA